MTTITAFNKNYVMCPTCGIATQDIAKHRCRYKAKPSSQPNAIDVALSKVEELRPTVETVKRKDKDSPRKLNKTEQRWFEYAKEGFVEGWDAIFPQCRVLPLKGGGSYRPDFEWITPLTSEGGVVRIVLIEIKGGFKGPGWEQGLERFRRARAEWEHIFKFELWTWKAKEKKWEVEK